MPDMLEGPPEYEMVEIRPEQLEEIHSPAMDQLSFPADYFELNRGNCVKQLLLDASVTGYIMKKEHLSFKKTFIIGDDFTDALFQSPSYSVLYCLIFNVGIKI